MKLYGLLLLTTVSFVTGVEGTKINGLEKPSASFCALMVPDAAESARWYEENLGFSKIRTLEQPNGQSRIIMLEQSGAMLEIIQVRDSFAFEATETKPRDRLQGIIKFGFLVDKDVFNRVHRKLEETKASFVGGEFTDDGLKMRSFIVRDHDGNMVQLFARI